MGRGIGQEGRSRLPAMENRFSLDVFLAGFMPDPLVFEHHKPVFYCKQTFKNIPYSVMRLREVPASSVPTRNVAEL
jgi:hypothetical protein